MKTIFYIILSVGLIEYLVGSGLLLIGLILGYFFNKGEDKKKILKKTDASSNNNIKGEHTSNYNPYEDNLHFDVYQQHFKTWWYDNDGDKHDYNTIYANLRFYEDGTVIGIRSIKIPKVNVTSSFTMKGNWTVDKNKVSINLKKIVDIDDTIKIDITAYEERQMKYAGKIADDNSLIKAGEFQGIIQGNNITIGNHLFSKLLVSTLIVTESEDICHKLEPKISNHDYIVSTFQDTGNWYSNGETGPEWFTIHIITSQDREEEIEALVNLELKKMDRFTSDLYWT